MSHYGDTLLRGAVAWRGKPPTFRPDALGETGEKFNEALVDFADSHESVFLSLTLEYLTGLVFNADYETLTDLAALVESWIVEASMKIKVTAPEFGGALWPGEKTFGLVSEERDLYLSLPLQWERLTGEQDGLFLSGYWGETSPFPGERFSFILQGPRIEGRPIRLTTDTRPRTRDPVALRSDYGDPHGGGYLQVTQVAGPAFRLNLQERLETYITGEQAYVRHYPDPAATAVAENGFVFANWAQEKFGSPEAR